MDLAAIIRVEFIRRRLRSPRYSLRAFATHLGVHHSTLLRLLNRRHRPSPAIVERVAGKLRLSPSEQLEIICRDDARTIQRLVGHSEFRPNCRWLAVRAGISLDRVNAALHDLLRQGRLVMANPQTWEIKES